MIHEREQDIQIAKLEERVSGIEKEQVTQNIRIDKLEDSDRNFNEKISGTQVENLKTIVNVALGVGGIILGYFLDKYF